jgi:hypothetical protein
MSMMSIHLAGAGDEVAPCEETIGPEVSDA